jgi:membrane protein implicated in regulation of membrane protease activity
MLWSTNSGIGFFAGWSRLPLPPGRKGRAIGLLVIVGIVAIFLALAYFFQFAGVVAFAIAALVLTWRPISKLDRENRARTAALQQELRDAAADSDTEFRVPD